MHATQTMEEPAIGALERMRDQIESIDADLVRLLARRLRLARAAGPLKWSRGLATADPAREAAVIRRAAMLARDAGLPEEDVRDIFWRVVALCRNAQLEAR
jgi:chorismate mutase/prephenate dehydrogenase